VADVIPPLTKEVVACSTPGSWGARTATATGKGFANTCTPSCVGGKLVTYPVKVVVSRLSRGQYHHMVVTTTGRHPKLVSHVSTYDLSSSGPALVIG